MATRQGTDCSTWRPKSKLSSELKLNISGLLFTVDKEILASKSSKLAKLLKRNPHEDLDCLLRDIPADQETLDIITRFCHGYNTNLSSTNVIRVACVAYYLEMTESQCPNNLLQKAKTYFDDHVIPSWNNSIKALQSSENILGEAIQTGLIDSCVESLIVKVMDDPRLLGEPIKNFASDEDIDENGIVYRPNARRKLFDHQWKTEDLTSLSLKIYEPMMHEMIRRLVPQEYIAANVCQYANKWLLEKGIDGLSITKRNYQRELVEALEQILPHQKGLLPCMFLFEMLKFAMSFDANKECKNGLEIRIGRQLDKASVADLLIPTQGYAKDEQYDTECIRRILKIFYANYNGTDVSGLCSVAELIEEFLMGISADIDLKVNTFIELADMYVAASNGTHRNYDGLYRALDAYLDKHRHLTESEREELCGILDCSKLSMEAREHAAMNERLPLRIMVQVLFIGQLKLRDAIEKEGQGSESRLAKMDADEGEMVKVSGSDEEVRVEMEKMGSKVLELEQECHVMRREIQTVGIKKEKESVWRQVKRKLGCVTSVHDRDCHVKKRYTQGRKAGGGRVVSKQFAPNR